MNAKQYHTELTAMATALDKLSRLEPVELTDENVIEDSHGNEWIEAQSDDEFWAYYEEICEIIEDVSDTGSLIADDDEMHPDTPNPERYLSVRGDGEYAIFSAKVYGNGNISVMAEFEDTSLNPEIYGMLFDGYLHIDYSAVEVSEQATELLIGFMTTYGLSSAEALDYWGTEIRNHSQYTWSNQREKSRQAVGKNVNQAKDKLAK